MNVTCLFPKCEEQLQPHDLDDHIRHHLRLKLYRCYCEKRFYTWAGLQEHLETIADDEIHCITNDCPGDVYLKALVSRIIADFKSAENGAPIPVIASNLRLRAHAVASRSASITPAEIVGEKRPGLETQEEVAPRKVYCSMQMPAENSADDLAIFVPARSASRSPIRPVALRPVGKSSERKRNFSNSTQRKDNQTPSRTACRTPVSTAPLNVSEQTNTISSPQSSKRRDHTLASREQSLASTTRSVRLKTPIKNVAKLHKKPTSPNKSVVPPITITIPSETNEGRTLHEAITDVLNMPTLPKEKMTLPPELANLGNVTCQKCPKLSFTVDFSERRTHVANTHVSANQGNWRYTGDYRKELAYQMRECFSDLASEDDLCVVCYDTAVKPTRYTSETGRMGHVRACHLPADKFLPCPFAFESNSCRMHRFKTTEDVNSHCQLVHLIEGYSTLKDTKKPVYEQFLHFKRIYNLFCSELKGLYFPVPVNSSAVTASNSPLRNEAANDNGQVVAHTDPNVQQEAQSTDVQPIKQENMVELQREVSETPPTTSRTFPLKSGTWTPMPTRPYSALSRMTGRRSFPSPSSGGLRNPFATAQRRGRGRQQQIQPNHDWHFRGNKF
ncbi:unnamed protein product, partial [Mesorhabditis belari]|uniref:C2H2-type domain-containing protein n=1 Tax=Mesorhabditis belari TaxID=2138241 RepID=A0AAF3FK90_9BILA